MSGMLFSQDVEFSYLRCTFSVPCMRRAILDPSQNFSLKCSKAGFTPHVKVRGIGSLSVVNGVIER